MIVVDKYLGREFHWKRYNCWDFIRDVWKDHCGVDLGKRDPADWTRTALAEAFRQQQFDVEGKLVTRIPEPEDPCLVMFVRPNVLSHVGIWVRGRVLHLQPRGNVILQPLSEVAIGFTEIRWYK